MALDGMGGTDFESAGSAPIAAPALELQSHFGAVKGQYYQEGVTPSVEGSANTAPIQTAQVNIVQTGGPLPQGSGGANPKNGIQVHI